MLQQPWAFCNNDKSYDKQNNGESEREKNYTRVPFFKKKYLFQSTEKILRIGLLALNSKISCNIII